MSLKLVDLRWSIFVDLETVWLQRSEAWGFGTLRLTVWIDLPNGNTDSHVWLWHVNSHDTFASLQVCCLVTVKSCLRQKKLADMSLLSFIKIIVGCQVVMLAPCGLTCWEFQVLKWETHLLRLRSTSLPCWQSTEIIPSSPRGMAFAFCVFWIILPYTCILHNYVWVYECTTSNQLHLPIAWSAYLNLDYN